MCNDSLYGDAAWHETIQTEKALMEHCNLSDCIIVLTIVKCLDDNRCHPGIYERDDYVVDALYLPHCCPAMSQQHNNENINETCHTVQHENTYFTNSYFL